MPLSLTFLSKNARVFLCACLLVMLPAHAKRLALVIGNDNYTSVSKLQKAGNDATAMARVLKAAGFTVQLHLDLNYRGMVKAVEAFSNSITGGDEVLVFFAGHGVQIKNGSYLLPTDIEARSEKEVEKTAYELMALSDMLSEAKPAFTLIMVDACRDNPLKVSGRSVGNSKGLSAPEPPKGQMFIFSASRGQQALDRLNDKDNNPNGIFTREFTARMQKPGVKVEDIVREVQDAVELLAKSVNHEQRPAFYNEARGNFFFFGPTTVQVTSQQPNPQLVTPSIRPSQGQSVSLSDLEMEEATRKEWSAWQGRMKFDFDKTLAFTGSADLMVKAWDRFLIAWAQDNPLSRDDDNLRSRATARREVARQLSLVGWSTPLVSSADSETVLLYKKAIEQNESIAQLSLGRLYETGNGGLIKDEGDALKLYRLSSNQGNSQAQNNLGIYYRDGRAGIAKNDEEALKFFKLSADQGNSEGQLNLARFYDLGRGGLAKDPSQAFRLYQLSANQNNANALYFIGNFYRFGLGGVAKDDVEAVKYYRLSANLGNMSGQAALGDAYHNGYGGINKDENEAEKYFRLSANQGLAGAQNSLAIYYRDGRGGVAKSSLDAERLFRLSANQGNSNAQLNLGNFYRYGEGGLTKNISEAVKLYKLSSDNGNSQAQVVLGFLYQTGNGVSKDEIEALRLYKLAASKSNSSAQNNIGVFFRDGLGGLLKDDVEAEKYFRLSATQGNSNGQVNLAYFYSVGRGGLVKDDSQAIRLYRLSSDQGNAAGQFNVGIFYRDGRGGISKDPLEALKFFRFSAENNYSPAQYELAIFWLNGTAGLTKDRNEALRLLKLSANQGFTQAAVMLKTLGEGP